MTRINNFTFNGCSSLTLVEIPNSVSIVGTEAFQDCTNLTSVTFGTSITDIGTQAFNNCPNIEEVTCLFIIPVEGTADIFDQIVYDTAPLIVHEGTQDQFDQVIPWKLFKKVSEGNTTSLDEIMSESKSMGDIYTVGGTLVKQKPTDEDVKSLAPGLYIIGNKKILIR